MKILFVTTIMQAPTFYRATVPARALAALGHKCDVIDLAIGQTELDATYDLYVFQRAETPQAVGFMKALKEAGKPVAVDYDDYLHQVPYGNPGWYNVHPKNSTILKCVSEAIRVADLLTVSTPELADAYGRANRNTRVLPNYLPRDIWQGLQKPANQEVVIGWAGSPHIPDLKLIVSTLKEVAYRYPQVRFSFGGNESSKQVLAALPAERVTWQDWGPIERYADLLATFDIGLLPLDANRFNDCKSWLKALEYAASGAAMVASPAPNYRRLIKHGETGLLVAKEKFWLREISRLIEDGPLRRRLAQAALEQMQAYWIDEHTSDYLAAYASIVRCPNG